VNETTGETHLEFTLQSMVYKVWKL